MKDKRTLKKPNTLSHLAKGDEQNRVDLSAPWLDEGNCIIEYSSNAIDSHSDEVTNLFVRERTRLHELYIREQEKTKRIGLILAAFMFIVAGAMVLFAPSGRETLSYWIGATLVIFAAGAVGYK